MVRRTDTKFASPAAPQPVLENVSLLQRFYWAGLDQLLAVHDDVHNNLDWALADKNNSIIDLLDAESGASGYSLREHRGYDAFGAFVLAESWRGGLYTTLSVTVGYRGQEELAWQRLYNDQGRWYDARVGFYTQESGTVDGTSPYGYQPQQGKRIKSASETASWWARLTSDWSSLDTVQAILTAGGFIPVVGAAFDLANAGISWHRGDEFGMWSSLIAAVPGVGDAVGGALKLGGATAKAVTIGTRAAQVGRAVGINVASNLAQQGVNIAYGRQEGFEWEQVVGMGVAGAVVGPLTVGAGRFLNASANRAVRTGVLATGAGLTAAIGDAVTQAGAIYSGRQRAFDAGRLGWSFAGGAIAGAVGQAMGLFDKTCFVAGTPLLTDQGSKPIEQFVAGDKILSRDQHDPTAPVVVSQVEETFVRKGWTCDVVVGGRPICTTGEHPFYVRGHGWKPAADLEPGDLVSSHDGQWLPVQSNQPTGRFETVYNLRVADHHTYFVGSDEWGFGVWVHNAEYDVGRYGHKVAGARMHHGVLDAWAAANIPGYKSRAYHNIAIELSATNHKATNEAFRQWLTERFGMPVGVKVDWTTIDVREIRNLSERMFDAANVPQSARNTYYRQLTRYIYGEILGGAR